jgi:hypothetical protein
MRKNPFEVLGITPEMVRTLGDEDLFRLVKANYRLLASVFHPDVVRPHLRRSKRIQEKAIQMNLAFEKLNWEKHPEAFQEQRRAYIERLGRGLRKVVREMEEAARNKNRRTQALCDSFMTYLLAGCDHKLTVLGLKSVRLGLNDVALGYNFRGSAWNIGKNYKEMEFDDEGNLFYRPPGRSQFAFTSTIRLLGAVEEADLDVVALLDKKPLPREENYVNGNPRRSPPVDGPFELRNSLSPERFKTDCLPFLKPDVAERRYLFSLRSSPSTEQRQFYCEGMVVKTDVRS